MWINQEPYRSSPAHWPQLKVEKLFLVLNLIRTVENTILAVLPTVYIGSPLFKA